jgi:hypothetical protein
MQNTRSGRAQSTCTECSMKCQGHPGVFDDSENWQDCELGYERANGHVSWPCGLVQHRVQRVAKFQSCPQGV